MKAIALGFLGGALFGYFYPTMLGSAGSGAETIFAIEYGMAGGVLTYTIQNYLRWRRRVLERVRKSRERA